MIKNIVFDLGGVLVDFNPRKTLSKYFDESTHDKIMDAVFNHDDWHKMDQGLLSLEQAAQQCCERLDETHHEKVTHMMLNWADEMPVFEDITQVIKNLHENGYKIYLLSNIPSYFYDFQPKIPALKYFDGFLISSDEKLIKPSPEIYLKLLEKFSLKAEECFFIDDMQRNVDAAIEQGFDGYVMTSRDMDALKNAMRESEINI